MKSTYYLVFIVIFLGLASYENYHLYAEKSQTNFTVSQQKPKCNKNFVKTTQHTEQKSKTDLDHLFSALNPF